MKPQKPVKLPLRKGTSPATPKRRRATKKVRARAATAEAADVDDYEDYEEEAEPNMKFSHALFVVLILHVVAVGGILAFTSIKARQSKTTASETSEINSMAEERTLGNEGGRNSTATAGTHSSSPIANDGPKTHTVVAGDTLTAIARKHQTSIQAIEKANNMTSYAPIRVGQQLVIPDKTAEAVNAPTQAKSTTPNTALQPKQPAAKTSSAKVPQQSKLITSVARVAPTSTQPQGSGGTYTVQKGDNPYSIARQLKVSYTALLELNKIDDPTKLQIGQELKVPSN